MIRPILIWLTLMSPLLAMEIQHIRCEGQETPLGIDAQAPRFSWILTSDEPNQKQSAYHLQIATSLENFNNKADVFDSGKNNSDASMHIRIEGLALNSSTRYFWRVRVWDKNDRPSEWSDPAWFETGLLNASDWQAQWISGPPLFDWQAVDARRKRIPTDAPPEPQEPLPLFRKTFSLEKSISSARAYICGLGYYELYLNGENIGDHLLDPAFTRYDRRALYVTYDVTDHLNRGDNAMGVMLGNGWYNMFSRGVWGFDYATWRDDPTLLCQINVEFKDGATTTIISDGSWTCAPGPITFNSIRQGETYDARREQPGWAEPGFDDSEWFPVHSARGPAGDLSAQQLPPIRIQEILEPKTISKFADGHYLVDFGQNMAGFCRITVDCPAGHEITLKHSELLGEAGHVDQRNISGLVASAPFQTDTYICKGEGEETWQPRFVYHGFQYVEINGFPGELMRDNIRACAISTDFKSAGSFECSSELLNQIQHNTLWSFRGNYHGYPTDCPHREKNGWTGDAHLAAETGLFNFDLAASYEKWITDISDEQRTTGEVAAIIPTAGWGYYWGNGPAWDSALLLIPWYVYLYTGDSQIIEHHYSTMKRYVDFLIAEKSNNGIVSWGLGDWSPAETTTPAEITSTAYFYVDLMLLSKFAGLLEKAADADYYGTVAQDVKSAFNKAFVRQGGVGNNSQTALGCALYQELLNETHADRILHQLIRAISASDLNLDFGILGAKYVPNALARAGYPEVTYEMIHTTDYPGWGHWITQGATTLWEAWDGGGSRLHIMYGDVSAWMYKYLAGIQPDPEQPGFKHFYIRPFVPDDLEWVTAEHQSPYGKILSSWKQENGSVHYELRVPVNTTATIELTGSPAELESQPNKETLDIVAKDDRMIIIVGSGNYWFRVSQ